MKSMTRLYGQSEPPRRRLASGLGVQYPSRTLIMMPSFCLWPKRLRNALNQQGQLLAGFTRFDRKAAFREL